jgi:2-(3-amino-3-carboxypropyl)histidine synthase
MKLSGFDFEEKRLQEEIRKRGSKRVLIHMPEGLKTEGPRLASIVEKTGADAIVSAETCYGACDLASQEAESVGADLLVHYGHSDFGLPVPQQQVPTIYVDVKTSVSVEPAVKKALILLKRWKKIGLVTTIQHVDKLDEARAALLEAGKHVAIGNVGRLKHAGQVIGCDYSNARVVLERVDAFLFVGGGRFHAIGVQLATSKPTIIADPFERRAFKVEEDVKRILKQRWASIHEAEEAKEFGVLIGLKSGQMRVASAMKVKDTLQKHGKRVTLLTIREITPQALMQFAPIDAFVNTACPRIALDDASRFLKPVLLVKEAMVLLGELTWEELLRKGWFED